MSNQKIEPSRRCYSLLMVLYYSCNTKVELIHKITIIVLDS